MRKEAEKKLSVYTKVKLRRNIKNDGTYPGYAWGEVIIKKGAIGYIVDIGKFLNSITVYAVHFIEENKIVGCVASELEVLEDGQEQE